LIGNFYQALYQEDILINANGFYVLIMKLTLSLFLLYFLIILISEENIYQYYLLSVEMK